MNEPVSALRVGDRLRDNRGRVFVIQRVHSAFVIAVREDPRFPQPEMIPLTRIHLDQKPRRSGFSLIAKP